MYTLFTVRNAQGLYALFSVQIGSQGHTGDTSTVFRTDLSVAFLLKQKT